MVSRIEEKTCASSSLQNWHTSEARAQSSWVGFMRDRRHSHRRT